MKKVCTFLLLTGLVTCGCSDQVFTALAPGDYRCEATTEENTCSDLAFSGAGVQAIDATNALVVNVPSGYRPFSDNDRLASESVPFGDGANPLVRQEPERVVACDVSSPSTAFTLTSRHELVELDDDRFVVESNYDYDGVEACEYSNHGGANPCRASYRTTCSRM